MQTLELKVQSCKLYNNKHMIASLKFNKSLLTVQVANCLKETLKSFLLGQSIHSA